jgi:demethylmenaquinone methyltransferase/2-methoxy-6-polyprenyl-1,4-benzoquinol methylase
VSDAVKSMFGRIAGRYDLLNRVLSARRDVAWRKGALDLVEGAPAEVLDLACGTFDLGIEAIQQGKAVRVHGCDFCQPMMVAGAAKRQGIAVSATTGDALHLPYADGSFDLAMVAYGWRNFGDPAAAARELHRVLRPGGQLLILEFFRPERLWPRFFSATFNRIVLPTVGGLLAGDAAAYRYLHTSIRGFLSTTQADDCLAGAGFARRRWRSFFGGVSHAVCAAR